MPRSPRRAGLVTAPRPAWRRASTWIRRSTPCVATEAGRSLQRHAQQLELLEAEALAPFALDGEASRGEAVPLAIAVNADSLATWFMPARGMKPQALVAPLVASGMLVELAPGRVLDVPLHWQHWR